MKIICDTHALLFWADHKDRLTLKAKETMKRGRTEGILACSDISFLEIAMLFRKGRLVLPPPHSWADHTQHGHKFPFRNAPRPPGEG